MCGRRSAHIEVTQRDDGTWWLVFEGPAAGNGNGDRIDARRAEAIVEAFQEPLTHAKVRGAGFYDDAGYCGRCEAPYCPGHWNVSSSGFGTCPEGHGKSLDPHWSPDW